MLSLTDIADSTKIEMVEISKGCPVNCITCGAFSEYCTGIDILNTPDIAANILQPVLRTRYRLIDLFNRYVTTHVNVEPLLLDTFTDLAELIHLLSNARSQVVAVTHGVYAENRKMRERLEKIVELIRRKVIPLCVISMDFARNKGQIEREKNFNSYFETLSILRDAIKHGRITVSLQGERNPDSPISIIKTKDMYDALLDKLSLTPDEQDNLHVDDRGYTKTGRAETKLDIEDSEDCDVIPDPEFVKKELPKDHKYRAIITMDGKILVQPNRPGKTYGDSVDKKRWKRTLL